MSWDIRRSIGFGPFRLNFSKSGIGWSVGVRGARVGKDAKGRAYSEVSIPYTGIYNRKYYNGPSVSHRVHTPAAPETVDAMIKEAAKTIGRGSEPQVKPADPPKPSSIWPKAIAFFLGVTLLEALGEILMALIKGPRRLR